MMLEEVDPARAAAREDREVLAALHALDQLMTLFHDREVGAEIRVEDAIEAEAVEGGDHLAGAVILADRMPEFLADGRADRGGGLDDDDFAIGHRLVDEVDLAVLA